MGGEERCMHGFGEKPEGKGRLRKPRRRKDLKETCWVWTGFIWFKIWALVNAVMSIRIP